MQFFAECWKGKSRYRESFCRFSADWFLEHKRLPEAGFFHQHVQIIRRYCEARVGWATLTGVTIAGVP